MIRVLCLLALCLPTFAVTTTTLTYTSGGTNFVNKNTQFATNTTENVVVVTVSPGHPVTVQFQDSADWKYRTTTSDSTTDLPVLATQSLRLRFTQTTTFYTVRTSADGVCVATPLLME